MICISCWSHGNRLDSIVALLWSRQALIHFSFTLLAKHIMWIWSFVPDSPRLTSLSPQAPDASPRSRAEEEEREEEEEEEEMRNSTGFKDSRSPATPPRASLRWPLPPNLHIPCQTISGPQGAAWAQTHWRDEEISRPHGVMVPR